MWINKLLIQYAKSLCDSIDEENTGDNSVLLRELANKIQDDINDIAMWL